MGLVSCCCFGFGFGFCSCLLGVPDEAVWLKGEKKMRRLVWWVRAELRKLVKKARKKMKMMKTKKRFCSFQYDPLSYSLNFDNGDFGFFC